MIDAERTTQQPPGDVESAVPEAGEREPRVWPALGLALVLIAAALLIARPWQDDPAGGDDYGIIGQVRPREAAAAELETAPYMGNLAPNFRLLTLDGQEVQLADLRGRPVFLNFWATWCVFCVTEMPAMQEIAEEYGDRLVVVGVNVGESAADASAFAEEAGIEYTLLLDPETAVTEAYDVRSMPTSLFLDELGRVAFVRYGVLTHDQMRQVIDPLVQGE